MPQYLVAIHHPTDFQPYSEPEATHRDIADLNREMVAAMIKLARTLDFQVVAEQVEDQESFEALRNLGVDFVQGYVVEKPRPLHSVH